MNAIDTFLAGCWLVFFVLSIVLYKLAAAHIITSRPLIEATQTMCLFAVVAVLFLLPLTLIRIGNGGDNE